MRSKQQWGYPGLLSRADNALRVEFEKIYAQHPQTKASHLQLNTFIPACKIAKKFLVPYNEVLVLICSFCDTCAEMSILCTYIQVRRRYAEYRSDPAAAANARGSMKLYEALSADNPGAEMCRLLCGTWGSTDAGMTVRDGWVVKIGEYGELRYEHAVDGLIVFCGSLEWIRISGNAHGALCLDHGGARWRLNYGQSRDNYLVWKLNRQKKNETQSQQIIYTRIS